MFEYGMFVLVLCTATLTQAVILLLLRCILDILYTHQVLSVTSVT
jgi:hypothetical protein